MKKHAAAFFLAFIIIVGATTQIADARGIGDSLNLTFNSTTATCTFTAADAGSEIKVTMTLWQGNTQIQSWSGTVNSVVRMNEQYTVETGKTYTLQVSYTIDGTLMPEKSVTRSN